MNKRVVFSTDPDEDTPSNREPALPANPAAPIPTRQQNHPVRVGLERKGRRGKTVSVITGVMSPERGKQALLKLIKNKLGTGGALKDDQLEIQGDHRDAIVGLLNELGYQAKKAGG
ncbi:MAG: hypothetical protein WDZ49_17385 [Litorilinea sp.]